MYNRNRHILSHTMNYLSKQRKRARRHKIGAALAVIVVFAVVCVLIFPAITMEREVICKEEEHTYTEEVDTEKVDTEKVDTEQKVLGQQEEEEDSLSQVSLTGVWSEDLLAVAESQLGYTESSENYVENEPGEIKGYTRYGEWYGEPYGDWDAMFVSFCLNCAKVQDFPIDSDCAKWVESLQAEKYQLYREASEYTPKPGDLVFFSIDESDDAANQKIADHVGIVKEVTEASEAKAAKIKVIEGDSDDCVQYAAYDLTDERITGYGELQENPENFPLP